MLSEARLSIKAKKAAFILKKSNLDLNRNISVRDASLKSGLSLIDADFGLKYLASKHSCHFSVKDNGELVYFFTNGFSVPLIKRGFFKKFKKLTLGSLRFLANAWVTIVLIFYIVVFSVILVLMLMRNSDSDKNEKTSFRDSIFYYYLFSSIRDAFFFTMHPIYSYRNFQNLDDKSKQTDRAPVANELGFYFKVNNFLFGPSGRETNFFDLKKAMLIEIEKNQGIVGLYDVIKVTEMSKEKSVNFILEMLLDFEGDIRVSKDGLIFYTFPKFFKNSSMGDEKNLYSWRNIEKQKPLMGNNSFSDNFIILLLNSFNFFMSLFAIANRLTFEKIIWIFENRSALSEHSKILLANTCPEGAPVFFGWMPFFFSLFLFTLPIIRFFLKKRDKFKIDKKNGRRGILNLIFSNIHSYVFKERSLIENWVKFSGKSPSKSDILNNVIDLNGDLIFDNNNIGFFDFKKIKNEIDTLTNERAKIKKEEKIESIIFSSR